MPQFERYIGVDYSGAETPASSLPGLRVYEADQDRPPEEAFPRSARKHWTRQGIAEWLRDELSREKPVLVGIDHAFSFPLLYFEKYRLPLDWSMFLDDFQRHWRTDDDNVPVKAMRKGEGSKRTGEASWLRLTECWTPSAKSVFLFDVQGQVATATHAGLPWLRYLRIHCGERVHFWPFDGWQIRPGCSVVAEVYPSLWMRRFAEEGERTNDQHAAYAAAAWLRHVDMNGSLQQFFHPAFEQEERAQAQVEGWILGVL